MSTASEKTASVEVGQDVLPAGSITVTPSFSTSSPPDSSLELQRAKTPPSLHFALPVWRKCLILWTTAWMALSVTFASTSLFSAVSEVASDLQTTPNVITLSNAAVIFTMGCSSFIWGPIGRLAGRQVAYNSAAALVLLYTVGAAMASNMKLFIAMRVLCGVQGTYFHVAGQTILAEVFEPTQRGTAFGFFLCGSVFGPAFGACVGGVIVTFTTWRAILWLQVAMMGTGLILSLITLPKTENTCILLEYKSRQRSKIILILKEFDPMKVFKPMAYPDVLITDFVCGLLHWSQYTLLAAPRHILTPRFHLNTPLIAGLFYLSPGVGFVLGTIAGGRYSDITVKKWIKKRSGVRLPQDRLKSGIFSLFFLIPVSSLLYGWGLQYKVGELTLPIVTAFFCAVGVMSACAGVNTYCSEAVPSMRSEIIAGKYLVQNTFAAVASGAIVPLIDAIGIGPASTIGVVLVFIGGALILVVTRFGLSMQVWTDKRMRWSGRT